MLKSSNVKNVFPKGRMKNIETVRERLALVVNLAGIFQGHGQHDTHEVEKITRLQFSMFYLVCPCSPSWHQTTAEESSLDQPVGAVD